MELPLHYIWKHKLFPLRPLVTNDGKEVEVINPGLYNHDAGPDFREAKIKIDGTLWIGNVEIHSKTSDWFLHHHEEDPAYDNIILHVVQKNDCQLYRKNGEEIPQITLEVPDYIRQNYEKLLQQDVQPRCKQIIPLIPRLLKHSWMSALTIERLEMRTNQIMQRRERLDLDWESVFFTTLARTLGLGKNGDALEQWAYSIPPSAIAKHRDDLFQIQAIFFGQAGFFEDGKNWASIAQNQRLRSEYKYMREKFGLTPISPSLWQFLRLRPQNFPTTRIAQLAEIYVKQEITLSKIISLEELDDVRKLFHFSKTTTEAIIINTVIPILFAYGKYRANEELCNRALAFLEQLPTENNVIVRQWKEAGVGCHSASDSQSLVQLNNNYCLRHDCLRCRFGYEFIRRTPTFMSEETDD